MIYTQIKFDTNLYWQAVRMREIELRLPLNMRYTADSLASEENELIFCALENEKIIASCQFVIENGKAKMRQVATKKSHQGRGIGKELLVFATDWFKKNNFSLSEINCHARVNAISFYQKMGFEIESEEFLEVGIPHVKMSFKFAIYTMI